MKKTLQRLYIGSLSGAIFLSGCSKSFTTKGPNDSILNPDAIVDLASMNTAVIGAYSTLAGVSLYGRDLPVIGDLMADNTFVEIKNTNRYLSQYMYTVTSSDTGPYDVWSAGYTGILRCNNIIDADITGVGVDPAEVAAAKAQAYGLRALLYFKMVNYYGTPYTTDTSALGVPLILHYQPFALPTRNSVGEVYAQMVSDLQTAFATGPDYSSSVLLSKYAMEAILARVYLYMGDYADAETAAKDVITSGGFSLVTPANFNAFWGDPSVKTDQVEVMFEIDEDVINNNGNDDLGGIFENGYDDIYCSKGLDSLYSATDVRGSLIIPGTTKSGAAAFVVNKYPNAGNADKDNPKVIRLAEVYLIAAEAAAQQGDAVNAKTWLNALMTQRDPSFAGYTDVGQALINDIVQERRKELAFEGDRFFDLNRLGLNIIRDPNTGAITAGPGNVNLVIPYPDSRRLAPIPLTETKANANIAAQQNPGYQ